MSRFLLPAILVLSGCGFAPVSGTYRMIPGTSQSDCPDTGDTGDTGGEPEESTEVVTVSEDLTTMTIGQGEDAITCALDGKDFVCDYPDFSFDFNAYGSDAVETMVLEMEGTWTSDTSFDMDISMVLTCTGADCATLGITDCTSTMTGTAELVE